LTYGYDNIYQLLSAKQGSTTKETYTYDLMGNRLSSLGVSPYIYNTSNELTGVPGLTYTYDNNGSTKTKSDGSQYTWDYENRLTQVVLPGTGGTVNFKYDPFGRRIQKSFTQGSTTTNTNYIWDGSNLLEEVDNNGNLLARYNTGLELDDSLSQIRAGSSTYYEVDGIGSVTSLSDSSGVLVNTYSYDSFGRVTSSSGTVTNTFKYSGREVDSETGLGFYRARYYDPNTGRFINEDPIRFRGGFNFYAYVYDNPVNLTDKFGLQAGNSQYCNRLLDRIQNIQRKIDQRIGELDEDPGSLPETCAGDKLKPSKSRAGHRMLINIDKANLAAQKALYLAFCNNDPPGVPLAVPPPVPTDNYFDRRFWERTTGLTGAALVTYIILSEGSRVVFPARNLVPLP
jgi:RHS repeat-associated protein